MKKLLFKTITWFLILWFPIAFISPVYAQFDDMTEGDLFSEETDESGTEETGTTSDEMENIESSTTLDEDIFNEDASIVAEEESSESLFGPDISEDAVITSDESIDQTAPGETPTPTQSDEPGMQLADEPMHPADDRVSVVQNAVLEGIQLSKEPGGAPDESIITCYFIFRDKPSSYFYEAKVKQKTIVFEFNDVVLGASPIPSAKEPPIQGFRIESDKVDANREVIGLNPEWHDILKVSFFFDAIPEITVKDEYSVISYSFRWSTNPEKIEELTVDEGGNKALLFSLIGGGIVLGGLGAFLIFKEDSEEETKIPLSTIWEDGIIHPDEQR